MAGPKTILVTGDVVLDWHLAVDAELRDAGLLELDSRCGEIPTRLNQSVGGALALGELVEKMARRVRPEPPQVVRPRTPVDAGPKLWAAVGHGHTIWTPHAKVHGKSDKVWRRALELGWTRPKEQIAELYADVNKVQPAPHVAVFYDFGLGFGTNPELWPPWVTQGGADGLECIIFAAGEPEAGGAPIGSGPPQVAADAGAKRGPSLRERLQERFASQVYLLTTVEVLRRLGLRIGPGVTLEGLASELISAVKAGPAWVREFRHVVVSLCTAGALFGTRGERDKWQWRILYDACEPDGAYLRRYPGRSGGASILAAAALAVEAVKERPNDTDALARALRAVRRLHEGGVEYHEAEPPARLDIAYEDVASWILTRTDDAAFPAVAEVADADAGGRWSVLANRLGGLNPQQEEELLRRLVRLGPRRVLAEEHGVPILEVSDQLAVIDRGEIEGYRNVEILLQEYAKKPSETAQGSLPRPLSIAFFGPPGSGKSLGVTQLARHALPGRFEPLPFSLAQMAGPADLVAAFHQIRDQGLRGTVPLAFWDEFDGKLGAERYGWLRHFLAPMQDGTFADGSCTRRLGRCVFVFAAGTADDQSHFREGVEQAGKEARGADFLSRLSAYIDIKGPDPHPGGRLDLACKVRRAVILRSLLHRHAADLFTARKDERRQEYLEADVHPALIRAFMGVPNFVHGARSIEAIITTSTLAGKRTYLPSHLPPASQLLLHVDPDWFLQLARGA